MSHFNGAITCQLLNNDDLVCVWSHQDIPGLSMAAVSDAAGFLQGCCWMSGAPGVERWHIHCDDLIVIQRCVVIASD